MKLNLTFALYAVIIPSFILATLFWIFTNLRHAADTTDEDVINNSENLKEEDE
ncbi:MAG: hypothetical protein GPJ51_07335 [Candidatus Heimdallarchaeota archaeon]|nr:hypothetical protein [Candidatus Heimdallarchaeota archaeon]